MQRKLRRFYANTTTRVEIIYSWNGYLHANLINTPIGWRVGIGRIPAREVII